MDKDKKVIETTVETAEKVVKVAAGVGLILLDVAATCIGALICAITSQD